MLCVQIHPIHLAYLYFYSALAHDTLAREATLKNRNNELRLAESHYLAAIAALSPDHSTPTTVTQAHQQQDSSPTDSPTSSTSSTFTNSPPWNQRRSSSTTTTSSYDSIATTPTASSSPTIHSAAFNNTPTSRKRGVSFQFPRPPCGNENTDDDDNESNLQDSSNTTSCEDDYAFALPPHTASFVALLRGHVAAVRELATTASGPHTLRCASYADPVPRPGREKERDKARLGVLDRADDEAACRRRARMERVFRPRFDPEGVRRLCGDALDELAQR